MTTTSFLKSFKSLWRQEGWMSSGNHWEPVLRVKLTHRLYTQTRWPRCVAITTPPCQQNMSAAMRRSHSASSGTDRGLRLQAAWAPIEGTNTAQRTFDPNKYKNNAGKTMWVHPSGNSRSQTRRVPMKWLIFMSSLGFHLAAILQNTGLWQLFWASVHRAPQLSLRLHGCYVAALRDTVGVENIFTDTFLV